MTPLPLGIAAGVYKTARDVPEELLDTIAFVTMGSYTSSYNQGNRELPVTELYDPDTETSINAKGLPNPGLTVFWQEEMDALSAMFAGRYAKLRISLSPRQIGELGTMKQFLLTEDCWRRIDEVELNLACPNHRDSDGLHPVLARDPQAVNDRLKEWSGYPGPWSVKIAPDTPEPDLQRLVEILIAFRPTGIVSANTRLSEGMLAREKLSVEKGGLAGAPLLQAGVEQVRILHRLLLPYPNIRLDACGGIASATAAARYQEAGADRGQLATVPYFLGTKPVQQIIVDQHFS